METVRLIGPGRAGRSLAAALADAGYHVGDLLARGDDLADAARGVDVLVVATPDSAVAEVAAAVAPQPDTVVVHLSGALGLDVLASHPRRGSLHPLVPLPTPEVGRVRLRSGITFAVAGDPVAERLARSLGGSVVVVDDEHRAAYHAAACIAANHVVALMGQVERVARSAGLGLDAFVGLARAALTDVGDLGPAAALTGPAARRDQLTLERHRSALDPDELDGYDAGVALATRLAATRRAAAGPTRPVRRASSPSTGDGSATRGTGPSAPAPSASAAVISASPGPGPRPRPRRARRQVRVIRSARDFSAALDAERAVGRRVGLVPTMGALHAGHRSLVERATAECDVVAATVFVNPLQFDDPADLDAYPRDLEADVALAQQAGASIVFAPPVPEMYPGHPAPPATAVRVAGVSEGLEGASRPGHFDGVATVVAKLFALAGPCRAYFGDKDFQQLAVVTRMVDDLALPVEVVPCATVREPDGLALSSRNRRLSADQRRAALALWRALRAGSLCVERGERDPARVRAAMAAVLAGEPLVDPDYAVVVDPRTLRCPPEVRGEVRLLVAARVGDVRLIDNLGACAPDPTAGTSPGLVLTQIGEER